MDNTQIKIENTRNVPGWSDAPIPLCHGGDLRSLTFCCKPGQGLTFGSICIRDLTLKKIGITPDEFIKIKEEFSKKMNWNTEKVCFGSISYCCLRKNGCQGGRDSALIELYKKENSTKKDIFKEYFTRKKLLAIELLKAAKNKNEVKTLIENLEKS